MQASELNKIFIDELRDIYSAENQLVKALPTMAKAAASAELRTGFEKHLEQTKGQVSRLEQIFNRLQEKPTGKKCAGMEGLIKEGGEAAEEDYEGEAKDTLLIGAAQRVEHYENRRSWNCKSHRGETRGSPGRYVARRDSSGGKRHRQDVDSVS